MGLDAVEIVMEVEESFGIKIPDAQASEIRTVGDLYSLILDETRDLTRDRSKCLSMATFFSLRRSLASSVDNASSIRPQTTIVSLISQRKRRALWARLQNEMDLRFPSLCRPTWVTLPACLAVASVSIGVFFWMSPEVGASLAIFLAMLAAGSSATLLAVLTLPFATLPQTTFPTFRGLVTQLMALNYTKLSERHALWNPTDVWNVLQLILVEQLGVKKEDVTPNANFVYDLGMG